MDTAHQALSQGLTAGSIRTNGCLPYIVSDIYNVVYGLFLPP